MQFYGKAEQAANRILSLFQSGDVPKALAPIFINRNDETVPCRKWSWSNQLLTALFGHDDARGFRQWQQVGRCVKKGEHGFPILVPLHYKRESRDDETGEVSTKMALVGFKAQIVFGHDQTNGEPLPYREEAKRFIESLPLIEVAKSWGLSVNTYNGKQGKPLGWYRPKQAIALGVENLSTWAHELAHAADDRLGNLPESPKRKERHWVCEIVAELGGAILLNCISLEHEADQGGGWEYIQAYARDAKADPLTACHQVLKRTCDAVALILDAYEAIQSLSAEKAVA